MLHQTIILAQELASKKWEGMRGKASQESQLRQALNTLLEVLGPKATKMELKGITTAHIKQCVDMWRSEDKSPSTINARLSVLTVLGVNTDKCWVRVKYPPKYWLNPEEQERLMIYLRAPSPPFPASPLLADYIEFVSFTGLRVEEALRLTWKDISIRITEDSPGVLLSRSEMTAPGTKTVHSRARLALGLLPSVLLSRIKRDSVGEYVFPITYDHLHESWDKARAYLGEEDNRMATLKALRRSAAHHLSVNGMPTDMVRQYLRHSNISTTLEYLNVVGGYHVNEQRKYLS